MERVNRVLVCPECLSTRLVKVGHVHTGGRQVQGWRCRACGRYTTKPIMARQVIALVPEPIA